MNEKKKNTTQEEDPIIALMKIPKQQEQLEKFNHILNLILIMFVVVFLIYSGVKIAAVMMMPDPTIYGDTLWYSGIISYGVSVVYLLAIGGVLKWMIKRKLDKIK